MTRTFTSAAVALAALALSVPAFAQDAARPDANVAGAFMAAAQAQDRQTTLQLLDEQVSIQFPGRAAASQGHGEGQPFVIGYFDGLFYGQRAVSLDNGFAPKGEVVRFHAHDAHDRYAIDVEVKGNRVVRLTVNRETDAPAGQIVATAVAAPL